MQCTHSVWASTITGGMVTIAVWAFIVRLASFEVMWTSTEFASQLSFTEFCHVTKTLAFKASRWWLRVFSGSMSSEAKVNIV